jgi:hypothetical protein
MILKLKAASWLVPVTCDYLLLLVAEAAAKN